MYKRSLCNGNIRDMKEITIPSSPNRFTGQRLFCKSCDRLFEVEKTDKIVKAGRKLHWPGFVNKWKDHFQLPCGCVSNLEDIK